MSTKLQLILTGVSGSGKTTVMNSLVEKMPTIYARPLQFTTRKPRYENEHDDYVFLSHEQFIRKLINGDFMEYVEYNKELYGVSKYFDKTRTGIFIVEPVGREALKRYFLMNDVPFISIYLKIDEESLRPRLEERGDSVTNIENRIRDFKYFAPSEGDIEVDGDYNPQAVMQTINRIVLGASSMTGN